LQCNVQILPRSAHSCLASRSHNPLLRPFCHDFAGDYATTVTMSGEGFDPCECMWNHISMQNLLSILRQSQDYCSDTECFSVSRIPGPQNSVQEPSDFLFTCLMIGFVVLLYAFRPRSLRQSIRNVTKSNNEPGSHDDPPSPPTMN